MRAVTPSPALSSQIADLLFYSSAASQRVSTDKTVTSQYKTIRIRNFQHKTFLVNTFTKIVFYLSKTLSVSTVHYRSSSNFTKINFGKYMGATVTEQQ